ncbi:hypothetical protein [Kosakonia pseudosacchari]|uniref:hypothetical protein n=1 Tax=Kosakonia pseudosacchari TaxID=1646340 RepID=UPI003D99723D
MDKSLQTTREVQAAQTETIKGLQRDLDKNGQDIEKLKSEVDRLKETNAELKAKLKVSSTLDTSKVADGGLFLYIPPPKMVAYCCENGRLVDVVAPDQPFAHV